MITTYKHLLVCTALLLTCASAQAETPHLYLRDGSGQIIRNGNNDCWQSNQGMKGIASCPGTKAAAVEAPAPKAPEATPKAPAVAEAASKPAPEIITITPHFASNRTELSAADVKEIEGIASQIRPLLQNDSDSKIILKGYADRTGRPDWNKTLSQKRAEAVAKVLSENGIPASRIEAIAVGDQPSRASASCNEKDPAARTQCLRKDRRVEIELPTRSKAL